MADMCSLKLKMRERINGEKPTKEIYKMSKVRKERKEMYF